MTTVSVALPDRAGDPTSTPAKSQALQLAKPSMASSSNPNIPFARSLALDNLPTPLVQPFKRRLAYLGKDEPLLPSTINIDQQGKLLKSWLSDTGLIQPFINTYNSFIQRLPAIMRGTGVPLDGTDGSDSKHMAYFINPTIIMPRMAPQQARMSGHDYTAEIYCDIVFRPGTDQTTYKRKIHLMNMPVMLGSSLDPLTNMSDLQKESVGESAISPGGFFIIHGSERLILNLEQLRTNHVMIYLSDDLPIARMLCFTLSNAQTVELSINKKTNEIFLQYGYKGNDSFNVYTAMRILARRGSEEFYRSFIGGQGVINIRNLILQFVRPEWQREVSQVLVQTMAKSSGVADSVLYLTQQRNPSARYDKNNIYTTEKGQRDASKTINDLYDKLFPQIDEYRTFFNEKGEKYIHSEPNPIYKKMLLLALMIARLGENLAGKRPQDNRDDWGLKRVLTAGKSMEILFSRAWKHHIGLIIKSANKNGVIKDDQVKIKPDDLSNHLINSLRTMKWGLSIGNSRQIDGLVDVPKIENLIALYRHLTMITVDVKHDSASSALRENQYSQVPFIDVNETPEGPACGITKNIAITAIPSLDRDESLIRATIMLPQAENSKPLVQLSPGPERIDACLLNGKVMGWCNGTTVFHVLRDLRRRTPDLYDIGLYYNKHNQQVLISSESSRLVAPLLIVNQETKQLVIVEKNLWEANWRDLLKEGAVEYIDPLEMRNYYVAMSMNDLDELDREIAEVEKVINNVHANLNVIDEYERTGQTPDYQSLNDSVLDYETSYQLDQDLAEEERNIIQQTLQALDTYLDSDEPDKELVNHLQDLLNDDVIYMMIEEYEEDAKNLRNLATIKQAIEEYVLVEIRQPQLVSKQSLVTELEQARTALHKLQQKRAYTHCQIDPQAISGISIAALPWASNNESYRNSYAASHSRQALGHVSTTTAYRMDPTSYSLINATPPLTKTIISDIIGLDRVPTGQTVMLMIGTYAGLNQDDAIVLKLEAVQRGLFARMVEKRYSASIRNGNGYSEVFVNPLHHHELKLNDMENRYSKIDENGIPKPNAVLHEGDCIIGRVTISHGSAKNTSIFVNRGEKGIIKRVEISRGNGPMTIVVKLVDIQVPEAGDKFTSRNAQKSVISRLVPERDMPYVVEPGPLYGVVPDMIINPLALPSRMTIAMIIEMLQSSLAVAQGVRIDASAFRPLDVNQLKRELTKYGYKSSGKYKMRNGMTGAVMEGEAAIGPCYYMSSAHLVSAKIQARGRGGVTSLTRQANRGRKNDGGIRTGEMEKDALVSHAASGVLSSLFSMGCQDAVVCLNCGGNAISNIDRLQLRCNSCQNKCDIRDVCQQTSQFGKVNLPVAMRVVMHYLAAAGINLSFQYEELINEISDYSHSKPITLENDGTTADSQVTEMTDLRPVSLGTGSKNTRPVVREVSVAGIHLPQLLRATQLTMQDIHTQNAKEQYVIPQGGRVYRLSNRPRRKGSTQIVPTTTAQSSLPVL